MLLLVPLRSKGNHKNASLQIVEASAAVSCPGPSSIAPSFTTPTLAAFSSNLPPSFTAPTPAASSSNLPPSFAHWPPPSHAVSPPSSTSPSSSVTEFVPLHDIPYILLSPDGGPYFSIDEFLASPDRNSDTSPFIPDASHL